MKFLFWILAVLSLVAGLFFSSICYISLGLGLVGAGFGTLVHYLGCAALVVCLAFAVLGIIRLRKGNVKKAIVSLLLALGYCAIIIAGMLLDDMLHSIRLEKSIAETNAQLYGENWDSAPAIEGIPELYQELLNKFYAMVRDRWTAEQLMDFGAVSMADYYGESSLDNIGFALMDLNGDMVDELVIGAVAEDSQQANAIFCIYTDPQNPFCSINSVEAELYYLHPGETEGRYVAEIAGQDMAWVIEAAQSENSFDFNLHEGAMDPAGRIRLELIPFSQYK